MIEVELRGGLGNCLFQYAAGRALAVQHRTGLILNASHHLADAPHAGLDVIRMLALFRLEATVSYVTPGRRRLLERLRLRERRREFAEVAWGYDAAFERLGPSTRLRGYFQCPRYWGPLAPHLRGELTPRRAPDDPAFRQALASIDGTTGVAVHVRRGDYVDSGLHEVCTLAYFETAMAEVRRRTDAPTFFVFSDDVAWCRTRLEGHDVISVELPAAFDTPLRELLLMSRCRHHIISNSTFSWWGAWLGGRPGQHVLAPDRWFTDDAMNERAMRDTVPPTWARWPHDGVAAARSR
jgi:hypothetical protein